MKVRIKESVAGTVPGSDEPFSFTGGQEVEVDKKWGRSLCEGQIAEPIADTPLKRHRRSEKRGGETR